MQKLLVAYNVHPNFLSVLLSFGDEPHLAEGSGSNIDIEPSPNGQTSIVNLNIFFYNYNPKSSCRNIVSNSIRAREPPARSGSMVSSSYRYLP